MAQSQVETQSFPTMAGQDLGDTAGSPSAVETYATALCHLTKMGQGTASRQQNHLRKGCEFGGGGGKNPQSPTIINPGF